jgi:hypothetical protein
MVRTIYRDDIGSSDLMTRAALAPRIKTSRALCPWSPKLGEPLGDGIRMR